MFRDNLLFQLVLLSIFVFFGIFNVIKGSREEDKKRLMGGILLLTMGWTKAVFFLEKLTLGPFFKKMLNLSELLIPLAGLIVAAIYIQKWRRYVLVFGILCVIILGVAYMSISRGSSKIALFKTSAKSIK